MKYQIRLVEQEVLRVAQEFPVVLIVGARQVGKSTLLQNLYPHLPMITFNPIEDVQGARKDPGIFLSQFDSPVIFDEVQFAPELLAYIKIAVDRKPGVKGQYFLTGSQNLSVLRSVAESMAGRVAIIEMSPMTLGELNESFTFTPSSQVTPAHWLSHYLSRPEELNKQFAGTEKTPLMSALWRGGLPGLIDLSEQSYARYFSGYMKTYVDRDIRTMAEFDQIVRFEDFVSIVAALTSQEINYNQIGREIDVVGKTAQRWLNLLFSTYMWRDVRAYTGNTIKRITRKRKGYFIDTGFACYLHRINSPDELRGHPISGALFETYISNLIHTILESMGESIGVYHWRTNGGAEVDIILQYGNTLYPIEVKMKSSIGRYEARGIHAFYDTYRDGSMKLMPGIIVYAGDTCHPVTEHVTAVPWNMVCKSA